MRLHKGTKAAALLALGLIASACSGSVAFNFGGPDVEGPAADLIAGELTEQVGLGEQTPECEAPEEAVLGALFTCTGTLADGRVVLYEGEVTEDEMFSLNSTNVIIDVERFETDFHTVILEQNPGALLPREGVDCGSESIVLENSMFTCDVAPDGEPALVATITMPDLNDPAFDWILE